MILVSGERRPVARGGTRIDNTKVAGLPHLTPSPRSIQPADSARSRPCGGAAVLSSRLTFLLFLPCLGEFAPVPTADLAPAMKLWQQGQDALLQDQPDQAIAWYHQSLKLDPALSRNFLGLAAAFLHKNQDEKAVPWLERYLEAEPEQRAIRLNYAELLWKLRRAEPARAQFQRVANEVQQHEAQPVPLLVQAHTRLMEIAAVRQDAPGESLHRGIGLYWLAWLKAEAGQEDDDSPESLLCQAAAELLHARQQLPGSARPCWYLYRVWSKLGQQQTARKWLAEAELASTLPAHDLTSAEVRDLQLACATGERERRR
jgi:tetratricopeptide (TPR) repeat protein